MFQRIVILWIIAIVYSLQHTHPLISQFQKQCKVRDFASPIQRFIIQCTLSEDPQLLHLYNCYRSINNTDPIFVEPSMKVSRNHINTKRYTILVETTFIDHLLDLLQAPNLAYDFVRQYEKETNFFMVAIDGEEKTLRLYVDLPELGIDSLRWNFIQHQSSETSQLRYYRDIDESPPNNKKNDIEMVLEKFPSAPTKLFLEHFRKFIDWEGGKLVRKKGDKVYTIDVRTNLDAYIEKALPNVQKFFSEFTTLKNKWQEWLWNLRNTNAYINYIKLGFDETTFWVTLYVNPKLYGIDN